MDEWRRFSATIVPMIVMTALLAIAACKNVPSPPPVQTVAPDVKDHFAVGIESRLILVPDNFFDGWDGWGWGTPNFRDFKNTPLLLDNWNLNILIRAIHADKRAITIDARRIEITSGQEGRVVGKQISSSVSWEEQKEDYSFVVKPTVMIFPENRRYVVLHVPDLVIGGTVIKRPAKISEQISHPLRPDLVVDDTVTKQPAITISMPDGSTLLDIVPVGIEGNKCLAVFLMRPSIIAPAVRKQFDDTIDAISFEKVPFEKAINYLRNDTRVGDFPIFVAWTPPLEAGIDRHTPVTVQLPSGPLDKTLNAILRGVSSVPERPRLGHIVEDGVITISTRENLIQRQVDNGSMTKKSQELLQRLMSDRRAYEAYLQTRPSETRP
ncbi:MAG: hypothetical protein FWD61_11780 [Phycisphaerales bacterium]|nr:hypothetical protein [Phycisphaerales bacterium]